MSESITDEAKLSHFSAFIGEIINHNHDLTIASDYQEETERMYLREGRDEVIQEE